MEDEKKSKRGRPRKSGSKSKRLGVRLTDSEYEELDRISKTYGVSKTDIVNRGLKLALGIVKVKGKL